MESFRGRLVVDMPRLLAGDESADVLVQNGDVINVPKKTDVITVVGEVYEPGTFRFNPNEDIDSYLSLAAGVTERARMKDIYVIKPNGSVEPLSRKYTSYLSFRNGIEAEMSPGSVIVVPTNYDYERPIARYRAVTSVVFESIASIAAFVSISK